MSANLSAAPTAIAAPPPRPEPPKPAVDDEAGDGHKLRASPLARRAAEEAGIDITHVRGTGPDGRVTKRDVDNFLREQQLFKFRRLVSPREGAPGSREELSAMRKTIAKRMALSKREIPHFYVTVEVAMEDAVRLKDSLEATELFEETVTYNDIIVKACALALGRYPRINASYEDEGIVIHPNINIGVAVAVEDGLILPVIHGCERLSLLEISRAAHRLVAKSSRGGFTSDELSGATFSISNMGMLGIEHFAAVIVPPQAAILAVSAIKDRPSRAQRTARSRQDDDDDGIVRPSHRRRRRRRPLPAGAEALPRKPVQPAAVSDQVSRHSQLAVAMMVSAADRPYSLDHCEQKRGSQPEQQHPVQSLQRAHQLPAIFQEQRGVTVTRHRADRVEHRRPASGSASRNQ